MAHKILRDVLTNAKSDQLRRLSVELSSNKALRDKLLEHPESVLKDAGIELDKEVRLGERERALIQLFLDPQIGELYTSGKIEELREHIIRRHTDLVGTDIVNVAGSAVADFDVAIEAEVVAVAVVAVAAVAIGAVDPAARIRILEADAGVLNARLAALEGRLKTLDLIETKINALESRIR